MFKIFDSLRFKAAISYGILFGVSMLVCFSIAIVELSRLAIADSNRAIAADLDELATDYLTGQDSSRLGREISLDEITEKEVETIRKNMPGAVLMYVIEQHTRRQIFRNFYIASEGRIFLARINRNGTVFSREIPESRRLEQLQLAIRDRELHAPPGTPQRRITLKDQAGRVIAGSSISAADNSFRSASRKLFDGRILTVQHSAWPMELLLKSYSKSFLYVISTALVIGVFCGYLISRRLLAGIVKISQTAKQIAADSNFKLRVETWGGGRETGELAEAFNKMNESNQRLFEELRTMTGNAAHELKTPLTRLQLAAEAAALEDKGGELAVVVAEECSDMINMINSLLEIVRTEAGIDPASTEDFDLGAMMRKAGELFQLTAEDSGISLEMEIPDEPVIFHGSRVKMERVFGNLLDNAIKFCNEKDSVFVTLQETDQEIQITVKDTGCGIAPEDIGHIFERLYRAQSTSARPGSGLGLPLAAAVVNAHGGKISVESTPGQGTTFFVTLPRRRD